MQFDWDQANEEHIALHRIGRAEVEQALSDPFAELVDSQEVDGEERFSQLGATFRGRLLVVAFTIRKDLVRPITAFDPDPFTARLYREGNQS